MLTSAHEQYKSLVLLHIAEKHPDMEFPIAKFSVWLSLVAKTAMLECHG